MIRSTHPTRSTRTGLLDNLRERRRSLRHRKPGAVPGSLVFEGSQLVEKVTIEAIDYGPSHLTCKPVSGIPACDHFLAAANPTWLNVTGLHEISTIQQAGDTFKIPQLLLEDILNSDGRPKIEAIEDAIFIQIKILEEDKETGELDIQQLSIYFDECTLITFCETATTVFNPILKRLKNAKGRLRNRGLDYLLWAILDTVVDHALAALHLLEKNLIELDELLQEDHTAVSASELYSMKHEIMSIQHLVRPTREIVHALRQSPTDLITEELNPFLDDLRDHSIALSDECEALREYATSIREYLLTELNNRMNNVMKVLTCISTIFLPLTFLAGIYGMNFAHMPELGIPWAYSALWVVFIAVGGCLVMLFRKMKWL